MHLKRMFFSFARFCTSNSTKQVIQTSKNLINPGLNDPVAFGYFFPKDWNEQKIYSLMDPTRKQILDVKIIQNKLGLSAGKILFTFKSMQTMQKYINRYNEDFMQTQDSVHRIVIKKFELKNEIKKAERAEYSKKFGVSLTNLDFDIDKAELQRLAQDFGEIECIDMPMRQNGLNMGRAKVYFKTKQATIDFSNFSDGLLYKERKLKSSVLKSENELKKLNQIRVIHEPKIVMKWNQDLYKRLVKKEAQKKQLHQHGKQQK